MLFSYLTGFIYVFAFQLSSLSLVSWLHSSTKYILVNDQRYAADNLISAPSCRSTISRAIATESDRSRRENYGGEERYRAGFGSDRALSSLETKFRYRTKWESKFTRAAYGLTVRVRCSHANYSVQSSEKGVFSLSHFLLPPVCFSQGRERSGENAITLVYPLFRKGKFSGVNAPRPSSDGALNNTLPLLLFLILYPFFSFWETSTRQRRSRWRRHRRRQSASLAAYFAGCSAV